MTPCPPVNCDRHFAIVVHLKEDIVYSLLLQAFLSQRFIC